MTEFWRIYTCQSDVYRIVLQLRWFAGYVPQPAPERKATEWSVEKAEVVGIGDCSDWSEDGPGELAGAGEDVRFRDLCCGGDATQEPTVGEG